MPRHLFAGLVPGPVDSLGKTPKDFVVGEEMC